MFGKLFPLLVALVVIFWAAASQSNVNGYMVAFFVAIIAGVIMAKDEKAYGQAIISGLTRPMFPVIGLAVILAAISGKLISASGVVQTIAVYIVEAGFTGKLFAAATFLITCLLAFSTGTSVGTYFVVIPILFPVGVMVGVEPVYMIGAIVSGAAFGDNLAPISDTTIASAATQEADLGLVVRTRMKYSIPAAICALICFLVFTKTNSGVSLENEAAAAANPLSLVMLVVPATIIALCLMRKHLITALSYGVIVGTVVGLLTGIYTLDAILSFPGGFKVAGILNDSIIGCMGTVAMLLGVFSMLGIWEASGLFDDVGSLLGKFARDERSGEVTIVGCIGILSMVTGVISVAIVAMGELIKEIGGKVGLDRYRRSNLMDCAGCVFCFLAPWTVHCVIPAQQSAAALEQYAVVPVQIPFVNFYSLSMLALLILMIITGYGRKSKVASSQTES
ncbi:MAG: hypothetical protein HFG20_06855 [Anaerotruncus sp.]|nr:hypothetical protein [Anaerotruncus sp.]